MVWIRQRLQKVVALHSSVVSREQRQDVTLQETLDGLVPKERLLFVYISRMELASKETSALFIIDCQLHKMLFQSRSMSLDVKNIVPKETTWRALDRLNGKERCCM